MRVVIMLLLLGIQSGSAEVRRSVYAGTWYPGRSHELRRTVESYLQEAGQKPDDGLAALIVPHAGYQYSAQTAAYGYGLVPTGKFRRVILVSPCHRVAFRGAAVGPFEAYETPLGTVPVDREACKELLAHPLISENRSADASEHAIEIQIPFLQVALGEFSLIPVLVRDITPAQRRDLAQALARHVDERTLIVASSDFTHYGYDFRYVPFGASSVNELKTKLSALNHEAAGLMCARDMAGLDAYMERTEDTICGWDAIGVLLEMLPKEIRGRVLHYSTSLDAHPQIDHSVSYVAIGFSLVDSTRASSTEADSETAFTLPESDRRQLVLLARAVVKAHAKGTPRPDLREWQARMTPAVQQHAGVFVTLMARGDLRGCIGYIEGVKPIIEAVADNAHSAAFGDPRFDPVTKAEYDDLEFKVSVLTPLEPVKGVEEIQVGRHGLVLSAQGRRGVFLPEVPVDQGWDRTTYLEHLGLKAGLDRNAWRRATLEKFESIVFGDEVLSEEE